MDDDEAFMTLILANTQGEMSPLEEGHHVAKYAERGEVGGRGKTGGLSEYARRLNKSRALLQQRRDAYRVYEKVQTVGRFKTDRIDYSTFLEIAKAPDDTWIPLVEAWSEKDSRKDTAKKVSEVQKFKIPDEHRPWLPRSRYLLS